MMTGFFYINHQQPDSQSILNDVVHEFAHHLEAVYTDVVYGDKKIVEEFIKKRLQLKFELQTEGYWVDEYDFREIKYNEKFDKFLYKRVGKKHVEYGYYWLVHSSLCLYFVERILCYWF